MAQIKPFKAIVYNRDKIKDLATVVCPPYDVISEAEQEAFLKKNPLNFIQLILGKVSPKDNEENNRYIRAKKTFEEWFRQDILIRENNPAIYFYLQEYILQGEKKKRTGFISLMRLEEENSKVYFHENTHSAPKEDRFELLKQVKANLSPIFVLFCDKERNIRSIEEQLLSKEPAFIDVTDDEKIRHKLWRLTEKNFIGRLQSSLEDKHIFIADGHHRYEVALRFKKFMLSQGKGANLEADFNYILTYFTNIDSRDLLILPFHRIVRNFPDDTGFLNEQFRIEKIKTKHDFLVRLASAGKNEHAFGLYTQNGLYLLRLKNESLLDKLIQEGSREYKRLDVSILKALIFDCLKISSKDLIYTQDAQEAMNFVDKKEAKVSFLLNPVRIEQLRQIALNN